MGKKKKRKNKKKHTPEAVQRYNRMKFNYNSNNGKDVDTNRLRDWLITTVVLLIAVFSVVLILTLPTPVKDSYNTNYKANSQDIYSDWGSQRKKYTELPAFVQPPKFHEYTIDELGYKNEKEKADILAVLTEQWNDVFPENYEYAIMLGQKLLNKNHYNTKRNYEDFVQYHLYDVTFKMIYPEVSELMFSRLEKDNYDLYREQALLTISDFQKETYDLYDKFVVGEFYLPNLNSLADKKSFVYAWRIYNGYDDYEKADSQGYHWFGVVPTEAIQILVDKYTKEVDKAYELQRWGDRLEISNDADRMLSDISKLSNIEQEKLYHSITGHWYGHRDYELFAKYRVAVAQQAKNLGVNTKSNEFIAYLNEIRAFNYKIAFWRVSGKDFNTNIKKEISLLKNFADKYEYEN